MSVNFYGLLIPPSAEEQAINLSGTGDPLDIYLRCAATCHASFRHWGYDWTLITNEPEPLVRRCSEIGLEGMPIRQVAFKWEVPADLRFRSAHYKLELMQHFASGEFGQRVGLIDLDAVCLAALPAGMLRPGTLVGYDMSEVARRSEEAGQFVTSLDALGVHVDAARWWGGEFILGDSAHFEALGRLFAQMWPLYLERIGQMAHVGDEMVLTASLTRLREEGIALVDGGAQGAIARYWSARTRVQLPPFGEARRASVLHLPADKPLLAEWSGRAFDPEGFIAAYMARLQRRVWPRRMLNLVDRMRGRPRLYVPKV